MRSLRPTTVAAIERSQAAGHTQWLVAERVDSGKRDAYGNVYVAVLLDRTGHTPNWYVVRIESSGRTIVTNTGHPYRDRDRTVAFQHALAAGNIKDWAS